MTFIQPVTTQTSYQDGRPWLVDVNRGANESGTISVEGLDAEFRDGEYLKSGLPVTKNAGTGLYEVTAADGTADGVIFVAVYAPTGVKRVAIAVMQDGIVKPVAGSRLAGVTLPKKIVKGV